MKVVLLSLGVLTLGGIIGLLLPWLFSAKSTIAVALGGAVVFLLVVSTLLFIRNKLNK